MSLFPPEMPSGRKLPVTRQDLTALLAIALFYGILELALGITCPIKLLTGISCPGCGMSRAWCHVLRADWQRAVYFHPLFWMPILWCLLVFLRSRISKSIYNAAMALSFFLFFAVYIRRMHTPGQDIVVFRPQDGLLFRGIASLIKALTEL